MIEVGIPQTGEAARLIRVHVKMALAQFAGAFQSGTDYVSGGGGTFGRYVSRHDA
jgi:hypothetical protein